MRAPQLFSHGALAVRENRKIVLEFTAFDSRPVAFHENPTPVKDFH